MDLKKKESWLKILIILGIIAILISLFIRFGKPYLEELSLRKSDKQRIADLNLLNAQLARTYSAHPDFFHAEPNTVYISLSSDKQDCSGLTLPSLPEGWKYSCKSNLVAKKLTGSGWIPVNLTETVDVLKSGLLLDPKNSQADLSYYAFISRDGKWVLTAPLFSKKYIDEFGKKDNGTDPTRFEIGENKKLWADAEGLIGYWPFDEGKGDTAKDMSGNGNDGLLINTPLWTNTKNGLGLLFNGENSYVNLQHQSLFNETTITFWIKQATPGQQMLISSLGVTENRDGKAIINGYSFSINKLSQLNLSCYADSSDETINMTSKNKIDNNSYSFVTVVIKSGQSYLYVNGDIEASNPTSFSFSNLNKVPTTNIGRYNFVPDLVPYYNGIIDNLSIYRKALSQEEIKALYNATK